MPRLRYPRVHVIQELYVKKSWTPLDIARKADLRPSTVNGLLAGRGVFLSTVVSVAKALGVNDHRVLLPSSDPDSLPLPSTAQSGQLNPNSIQVTLTFNINAAAFQDPEVCNLLNRLRTLVGATGDIEPRRVADGSIIVTADMSTDDFFRLLVKFDDGTLTELELSTIRIPRQHVPYVLKFLSDSALAKIPPSLMSLIIPHAILAIVFTPAVATIVAVARVQFGLMTNRPIIVTRQYNGSIKLRKNVGPGNKDDDEQSPPELPDDEESGGTVFSKISRFFSSMFGQKEVPRESGQKETPSEADQKEVPSEATRESNHSR